VTPARFAQVKQVFLEACARAPAERECFLADCCGADVELRAEVAALLAVHTAVAPASAPRGATRTSGAEYAPSHKDGLGRHVVERNLQSGTVLADRFRIVALLGVGGMGEVYRADDLRLDQPVALKFLPLEFAAEAQWLARLYGEVRLARTITHANVCRVYDINEVAGDHFISMEYVDGENLKTLLKRIGRLPGDKAAEMARQLCAGLAAAHARGVLHRDLKPANAMLDGQGRIRIMDFGLAALHDQVRGEEIRVGTPAYMAPEQFSGAEVSVRSDIYSLGLVLYELFTGQPAFAPSAAGRASSPRSAPSHLVPDISPATERAILRCLEPNPTDRPASVLELTAALPGGDALRLAQELGQTPSPTLVAATGQPRISRRVAAAALAAFVVLLAAAVMLGSRTHPLCKAGSTKPPAVLAEKARDQLLAGGLPRAAWEAYGFTGNLPPELATGPVVPFARFTADPRELLFWYRSRSTPLVPVAAERLVFGGGRTTLEDPPFGEPGEAALVLDIRGKLRAARLAPVPDGGRDAAPDWNTWHRSAGLDPSALVVAESDTPVPILADRRWTWRGTGPAGPGGAVRVEAAAYHGQPIWYATLDSTPDTVARAEVADVTRRQRMVTLVTSLVLIGLFLVALPLTRLNLLRGCSDSRGATRLAAFVFAVRAVVSLLQAAHTPVLVDELRLLTLALTGAVGNAVIVWLFYVALEPFARRYWPQLLVSWVRVLGGRLRDPLVGRDLLLGAVLGVAACVLYQLEGLVTVALGLPVRPRLLAADFFAPSLSLREAVGFIIDALRIGVYTALWLMLMVVLLRHVLRRAALAGVVAVLLVATFLVPQGSHVLTSFIFLALGIGGGLVWTALRYGLVPVAVAIAFMLLLRGLPLTFDLHVWYAESTVLALLITGLVAVYGFLTATRGARSLGETS
jgi:hypothetical protein